jgi:hypothetical protein
LPIVVAADASAFGVGAVILHCFPNGTQKAIMHASRTLNSAEKRYSQIEKQALALVFAVRRFHKLVYGRKFTLLTDHKPLLSVFGSKSGIPAHTANRLQRWALVLLAYDFDIEYRRTDEFGQADALSRLISDYPTTNEDAVIAAVAVEEHSVGTLASAVRALPVTAADIQRATSDDPILQRAIRYVLDRWPSTPLDEELQQLFHRREALCVVNNCLMFMDRVVVPQSLRLRVLRQFHSGHPGIGRMKSIARSFAYWPQMDQHIVDFVRRCSQCQQAAKNPPRLPPAPWPQPQHPWSRVHLDFAGPINGISYLVLVDAFSKWPEIVPLVPPSTTKTLQALSDIFSHLGFPETIVTDNGTQFTAHQFAVFCQKHAITHIRSPPYHPQSNGQAERFVDTFKRALLKSRGEGATVDIIQKFLFAYRTTPNDNTPNHQSPAEALMGRKLRTAHNAMIPKQTTPSETLPVSSRPPFEVGSWVYCRDYRPRHDDWTEGQVIKRRGKVMYDVAVGQDVWSRHHNQLRQRHASKAVSSSVSILLDLLLDTFQLPANSEDATATTPMPYNRALLPRRWTDRRRRQTQQFQVNPKMARY